MINFTVGPVQSNKEIRKIGSEQVPYFRTEEFSNMMFENEKLMKEFVNANDNSKVVFITGSGTASMEAAVSNLLTKDDKILVINGGSFGERFAELCKLYELNYTEIKLEFGKTLTKDELYKYDNSGYTALLVNVHETSSGVHYDMEMIGDFCKKNNIFLIADNISSFLADKFNMKELNVNVMITGSQKALACPPGISIIVLSKEALERLDSNNPRCLYLNLKTALENAKRGQTPFTPAVATLIQIHERLLEISKNGGVEKEVERTEKLANYFRNKIKDLPFKMFPETPSNAVTALEPYKHNAYEIFKILKDEYNIWICPNGGEYKDKVFRVGHIGYLTKKDYDKLISAFRDLKSKDLI